VVCVRFVYGFVCCWLHLNGRRFSVVVVGLVRVVKVKVELSQVELLKRNSCGVFQVCVLCRFGKL
jgi:hypothetical protein